MDEWIVPLIRQNFFAELDAALFQSLGMEDVGSRDAVFDFSDGQSHVGLRGPRGFPLGHPPLRLRGLSGPSGLISNPTICRTSAAVSDSVIFTLETFPRIFSRNPSTSSS